MKNYINNNKGSLVLFLAVGIVILAFVFGSFLNRARNEYYLSNRVYLNESLNQLASAIGRISLRKLHRDIELIEENGEWILEQIIQKRRTGILETRDYSSVIKRMKVIKEIMDSFNKKWGDKNKIDDISVKYICDLGAANPFQGAMEGRCTQEILERAGNIRMVTTIKLVSNYSRSYTIQKDFLLCKLIAPPFYRFTLFSHKGADLSDKIANAIENDEFGVSKNNKKPLICINRLIHGDSASDKNKIDYAKKRESFENDINSIIKNGWIYLGGEGKTVTTRLDHDKRLLLNIMPGSEDDNFETKFGEIFHFYFNNMNLGWVISKDWADWFKNNISGNSDNKLTIAHNKFGIYKNIVDSKKIDAKYNFNPPYFNFAHLKNNYYQSRNKRFDSSMEADLYNGNSMHLFGTSSNCTPTLIFGKVNRRYLSVFSIVFQKLGKFLTLRTIDNNYVDLSKLIWQIKQFYEAYFQGEEEFAETFEENLTNKLFHIDTNKNDAPKIYANGVDKLPGLMPIIHDSQPYMECLKNICAPDAPHFTWQQAVKDNVFVKNSSEELCVSDFEFKNEHKPESNYVGKISDIKIDYNHYLDKQTTYTIEATDGNPISFKNNQFINNNFFTEDGKYFYLNQILRIKGDLNIDKDIIVAKGGIIICDKKITITAKVLNKFIEEGADRSEPDCFGYVTLIAKEGIEIKNQIKKGNEPPYLEAFLVAGCGNGTNGKVLCDERMHFIGGIAADNIDDLVEKGHIIEWGFDPGFCTNLNEKSFYGLTLGPRDIEKFDEGKL